MVEDKFVQKIHENTLNTFRRFPVTVVLDGLRTPANIGMALRLCEALGVNEVILHDLSVNLSNRGLQRAARQAEKNLRIIQTDDVINLLRERQDSGALVAALELSQNSINLTEWSVPMDREIIIIAGNERFGIQQDLLNISDICLEIQMFGQNSSMNVVGSLSIALYETTKQLNKR